MSYENIVERLGKSIDQLTTLCRGAGKGWLVSLGKSAHKSGKHDTIGVNQQKAVRNKYPSGNFYIKREV